MSATKKPVTRPHVVKNISSAIARMAANPVPAVLYAGLITVFGYLSYAHPEIRFIIPTSRGPYPVTYVNLILSLASFVILPPYAVALASGRSFGLGDFRKVGIRAFVRVLLGSGLCYALYVVPFYLYVYVLFTYASEQVFAYGAYPMLIYIPILVTVTFFMPFIAADRATTTYNPFRYLVRSWQLMRRNLGNLWLLIISLLLLYLAILAVTSLLDKATNGEFAMLRFIAISFMNIITFISGAQLYIWAQATLKYRTKNKKRRSAA